MLVLEEAMGDLGQMIRDHKKTLSLAIVRRWSRDLVEGLAYLHSIRSPRSRAFTRSPHTRALDTIRSPHSLVRVRAHTRP
jgi:serine/threonine protein kinase